MTDEQLHKALNDIRSIGHDRPTLRDQFAMAALTALIAEETTDPELAATYAYGYADAMLEARKEKND